MVYAVLTTFLLLIGGAAASVASAPQATAHLRTWEFKATPGALVATRGGQEVWRRTGPLVHPSRLELEITSKSVLLLSQDWKAGTVILTAYDPSSGTLLWKTRIYDRQSNADAGFRGVAGRTMLLSGVSGEPMQGRVFGVDLNNGKSLWQAGQDLVGFTDTEALILDLGLGAQPMNSPHLLPLTRVNAATGTQTKFTLTLPERPGCGEMNYQGSIPDLRFTNRYLYALRQDSCGKFIVRFPWQGDIHTPLVYPDRRPPLPSVPPSQNGGS